MGEPELTAEEFRIVNGLARVPDASKLRQATVPVIYEEACRAVAACSSVNEAKYWSDKADALAAWAKIYCDDRVTMEAKRLKLHAYRRMAELADATMHEWRAERGYRTASVPIILKDHGIPEGQARIITKIGEMPRKMVENAIARAKPPTPATLALVDNTADPQWTRIKRTMSSLDSMTDNLNPEKLAARIPETERDRAHNLSQDLVAWLYSLTEALEDLAKKPKKRASNE